MVEEGKKEGLGGKVSERKEEGAQSDRNATRMGGGGGEGGVAHWGGGESGEMACGQRQLRARLVKCPLRGNSRRASGKSRFLYPDGESTGLGRSDTSDEGKKNEGRGCEYS